MLVAVVAAVSAPVHASSATPALVPRGRALPLATFYDQVVDAERGRIFVSGGAGSDAVVVTNYDGHVLATIPGLPDAAGMALDDDTLYVAREHAAGVYVVDTGALVKTRTLPLPHPSTGDVAFVHHRLWVVLGTCDRYGVLYFVDPRSGEQGYTPHSYHCPDLEPSPFNPHLLYVAERDLSPAPVVKIDVSRAPATLVGATPWGEGSDLADMAISADGETLLTAHGHPYTVQEHRTSDMALTGFTYGTATYPHTVATTDAGGGFVAVSPAPPPGSDVAVYPWRSGTATVIYDGVVPAPDGLEFVPQAARLVSIGGYDPVRFHALDGSSGLDAHLSLTASEEQVVHGRTVSLTAQLSPTPGSSHRTVSIYAIPFGGTEREIARAPVGADGALTVDATPSRNTTYVARWAGDDTYLSVNSDGVDVFVKVFVRTRLYGWYGTSGVWKLYRVGDSGKQVGVVVPNQSGRDLVFEAQQRVDGQWVPAARAAFPIGADGRAVAYLVSDRPGYFRTRNVFADHWDYRGAASNWQYLRYTRATATAARAAPNGEPGVRFERSASR
ncbi:MAG TPA: hypothetical protein VHJ34_14515 [Actinomycetota bacterium]|nr:hypothetical protein [Actinomycetota bacterium]